MSNSRSSQSAPLRSHLPRKLVIVFMLVIDLALGLVYVFQKRPQAPVLGRTLLIDIGLGLAAGLGVRLTLNERHGFIRFIVATAAMIAGLFVLGLMTGWKLGIGPLAFGRKEVDWLDLAQISLGLLPLVLVLQAWGRRAASANPAASITTGTQYEPVSYPAPLVVEAPAPRPSSGSRRPPSSAPVRPVHPKTRPLRGKAVHREPALAIKAPSRPKWRGFGRKAQMHFSKQEKHLCPFCLEPVVPHDPRGVVECKICHALHHGDCWEITGTCQVPHYNA